jgi:hypothetical protein
MSQDLMAAIPHQGFDCADLSPGAVYSLLTHCVAPRPIAFVSTVSLPSIYWSMVQLIERALITLVAWVETGMPEPIKLQCLNCLIPLS